ncbi:MULTISPECIES: hypothetical protein [Haloferax]|uniref:hypothetical protein n=1 Tax=Haloferax TaxID=2251 RepID=UPI0017809893|nr:MULTISPECIES: hypothetical protein [Haloferax]
MALDVENPSPPDMTNRGVPTELDLTETYGIESDFRREELQEYLHDGAWKEAFEEWTEYTDLSDTEYEQVLELGLIEQLDFFWDPVEERLQSVVPDMPDEWPRGIDISSKVRTELSDLGDAVTEMLEDGYVDWGTKGRSEKAWSELKYSEELEFTEDTEFHG